MIRSRWYAAAATLFGLGRVSRMPGTIAAMLACAAVAAAGGSNIWMLAGVALIGLVCTHLCARDSGCCDEQHIVIDDFAGYLAAMFDLPVSYCIIAFFLFRVVDILKPFPIALAARLPGGLGMMADDIVAGAEVNLLLRLMYWLFFSEGLAKVLSFWNTLW